MKIKLLTAFILLAGLILLSNCNMPLKKIPENAVVDHLTLTLNNDVEIRSGPGPDYERINLLKPGTSVQVIGRSADSAYLVVRDPAQPSITGWLKYEPGLIGNTDDVPVATPPPPPTALENPVSPGGCPTPIGGGPTPVDCSSKTPIVTGGCPTPIGGGPTPVDCSGKPPVVTGGCPTPIGGGPTPVDCSSPRSAPSTGSGCPTPIGGGPTPVDCSSHRTMPSSGSGCPTPIGGGPTPVSCSGRVITPVRSRPLLPNLGPTTSAN
ncbi:MAG: hypothetical protein GYA15_05030 [Leptolinea sp.]|nr:hypothetical protein [Leptolinea sp.]